MPNCKKCRNHFPNRISIENKIRVLNRRKYCLDCSPFGKHNTKKLIKTINRQGKDIRICKNCQREFEWNPKKGNTGFTCNSCKTNKRRFKLKEKAIEYKGGKCNKCGYRKCSDALHFHHIDPSQKDFTISGNHTRAWNLIKLELDKCILVCANCHAEIHANIL